MKWSGFPASFDSKCKGCGGVIKEGGSVYGTTEMPTSGKGKWYVVCPDCYKKYYADLADKPPSVEEMTLEAVATPSATDTEMIGNMLAMLQGENKSEGLKFESVPDEEQNQQKKPNIDNIVKAKPWSDEWVKENATWSIA